MRFYKQFDSTANDSDKSFVVPSGETWDLSYLNVILASTATVGNRQVTLEIQDDSSNVITKTTAGAVQAASGTVSYIFGQSLVRETSVVAGVLNCTISDDLILLPGWTLRVYDSAAIDAAADDMTISFLVKQFNYRG